MNATGARVDLQPAPLRKASPLGTAHRAIYHPLLAAEVCQRPMRPKCEVAGFYHDGSRLFVSASWLSCDWAERRGLPPLVGGRLL